SGWPTPGPARCRPTARWASKGPARHGLSPRSAPVPWPRPRPWNSPAAGRPRKKPATAGLPTTRNRPPSGRNGAAQYRAWSRGPAWWAVAGKDVPLWAGGGDLSVGVEAQRPAPPVDGDEVVEGADGAEVAQGRGPAPRSGDEVVD